MDSVRHPNSIGVVWSRIGVFGVFRNRWISYRPGPFYHQIQENVVEEVLTVVHRFLYSTTRLLHTVVMVRPALFRCFQSCRIVLPRRKEGASERCGSALLENSTDATPTSLYIIRPKMRHEVSRHISARSCRTDCASTSPIT
jgi:hypothetical protein